MLIHLLEDVATDTNYRIQAERIIDKIIQELEKYGTKKLTPQRGRYYITTPDKLGYDADFNLILRQQETGYEAGYDHTTNTLHVFIDINKPIPNQLILKKSHLIHEIIHYFDMQRSKGEVKGSSHLSNKDYYNNSFELNAFYQEIIFQFEKYFKKLQRIHSKEELGKKINNFDKFYNLLFQKFFPKDFKNNINDKNTKRIKKRMYQYYDQQFIKDLEL